MNKPAIDNNPCISAMTQYAHSIDQATAINTPWLEVYRQKNLKQLQQTTLPTHKDEYFKYNRLDIFKQRNFSANINIATATNNSLNLSEKAIKGIERIEQIVFINGQLSNELSSVTTHKVTQFCDANTVQQHKILKQLNSQSNQENKKINPFTLLNACLVQQGVLIEIDEESNDNIIEILNIIDGSVSDSTFATNIVIDIADNSKATIISRAINWDLATKNTNLSTQQTLVNIGKNSQFTHYSLQLENAHSVCFSNIEYNLQSNATLEAFYGATGSILKKIDITVNHLGQYTNASLNGLYAAAEEQQIDYHTIVNHPLANGQTNEVFRGIVNHKAEATFNGRIHIYKDAQKTRAELSNKNLVLSDDAVIHTKPELEIYADDVICAHGATVSRMDNESLNYLQSRAIPKDEAQLMLSYGFFNEILADLKHHSVADYLRPILFKRFI